ncbi:endonuclease domain-containing 1 protein-like isoform X2 [Puntigrus tetrazona]|uniref:endonuclease domain-containing 1 protein-like isoform X2 n=1 Tax=Puntigrus tetrazona TaxID=1606681 RepID=UPI001C8A0E7F|nr:endonuclease domain-containing 1 protein-like isoform X2 [Puntigrus tetrazona]XP_043099890.1 endonuclease domain-containing 1 protein-like isoform X2 [Puntigrus tetrazona]
MHTAPTGIRGGNLKRICQRYEDKVRYATLYDSGHRLALYSAYTFKKSDGQRRMDTPWMYEPQLVSADESGNMRELPSSDETDQLLEESQAVLTDYVDAVEYERGPLNPDQHQADNQDKAATYTLTNVVPQITDLLEGPWAIYIDRVRRRLNNFCHGAAYVVTGVTVSGVTIRRGREDRMTVPKHLWSAYCCPRFDRNSPYDVRYMFPTYAAYALNEIVGHSVTEVPLNALETFLKSQTGMEKSVSIFFKDCLTENTHTNRK